MSCAYVICTPNKPISADALIYYLGISKLSNSNHCVQEVFIYKYCVESVFML